MPSRASVTALRRAARCPARLGAERRAFSTTPCHNELSRQRTGMFDFLNRLERSNEKKDPGPNYLGGADQPFPQNPFFRSQPVLDENARETIWRRVQRDGEPLKVVSADLGVDVRRVAAVVRLKEIEKSWVAEGKKLAKPYSRAILGMLPKTSYDGLHKPVHEPINDVHVHGYTMQQVFLPTSESRHFTREDAAQAFHRHMRSADDRSQHPELVEMMRGVIKGEKKATSADKFVEAARKSERGLVKVAERKKRREETETTKVASDRFEFRIRSFNSEEVGPAGRAKDATGWRYGVPLDDRKRGKVKIPTSVP